MRQALFVLYVLLYSVNIVLKLKIRALEEIQEIVEKLVELADKVKEGKQRDKRIAESKQVIGSDRSGVNGRQGSGTTSIPNVVVLQGKRQSC
jgi:tryptophan 2,3-dioxygenase